jgi:phosphopantothenoylcysteine synthetase/decarboxylase
MNYYSDETEWDAYKNENLVQHIELTKKADVFLIAPCTANTLAKIANGICDNLVTCCVRAFPLHKRLIIAPAMNTNMWENPITQKHVSMIRDQKYGSLIRELRACLIIDPISKELFCGDTGVGAMANIDDIVNSI